MSCTKILHVAIADVAPPAKNCSSEFQLSRLNGFTAEDVFWKSSGVVAAFTVQWTVTYALAITYKPYQGSTSKTTDWQQVRLGDTMVINKAIGGLKFYPLQRQPQNSGFLAVAESRVSGDTIGKIEVGRWNERYAKYEPICSVVANQGSALNIKVQPIERVSGRFSLNGLNGYSVAEIWDFSNSNENGETHVWAKYNVNKHGWTTSMEGPLSGTI